MIDRLEELLAQVEESENGGEISMQLPGKIRLPAAEKSAEEEGETAAAGDQNGLPAEELLSGNEDGGRAERLPLLRTLTRAGFDSGMDALYRQLSRSVSGGNTGRSGSAAVVRETVSAPAVGLTAGELDLAMRRDSRRYDGGMTIY